MLKTKNTNDLRQELAEATDLDYFLQVNEQTFQLEPIPDLLNRLVAEKNIQKANLARNSGMSEVYLHQVFSGRRNPSEAASSACALVWASIWKKVRSCCGAAATQSCILTTAVTPF